MYLNTEIYNLIYSKGIHWKTKPKECIRVLNRKGRLIGTIVFKNGKISFKSANLSLWQKKNKI